MESRRSAKLNWLRFGLRSLLAATFLFAIPLAWLAWQLGEGRQHQRIASELQSLRCSVRFSHKEWVPIANPATSMATRSGTPIEERSTLPALVEKLGLATALRRIDGVTLRSRKPEDLDAAFNLLKELGDLDSVSFYDTGVAESQLSDLLNEVRIKKLYVQSEKLPRTRMTWLSKDTLTWLCVSRTQFSNPAIEDLPLSLNYLDATRTRINDDGLDSFVRLRNLKTLNLRRTPTTNEAITALRKRMPWCKITCEPL